MGTDKISKNNIAAILILYNPNFEVLKRNIEAVVNQVDKIYIIDNSKIDNIGSLSSLLDLSKNSYIFNGGNLGIAKAMNVGYQKALDDGYSWALSLDQDSEVEHELIDKYIEFLNLKNDNSIGILQPYKSIVRGTEKPLNTTSIQTYEYMTSGSLVRLNYYRSVGGFNDNLFIDLVDTEFGIKMHNNGYSNFLVADTFMSHNIGDATELKILDRHIAYITHHNYIRRYYITRNLLYMGKYYPTEYGINKAYFKILKSVVRLLLFESEKIKKLKSVYRGIIDFKNNQYGEYKEKNI